MELASGSRTAVWTFSVKGGVGKTTWARGLRALARAAGQPIAAYDGDGMRGGLTRYEALRTVEGELLDPSGRHFLMLQDALEGVVPFYMRDPAQRDMLLNVIDTSFQTFLIDFPGDIEREIEEIVGATREVIRVYRESGVDVVVVIPITTEPTSINSIEVALDAFEDMVRYIVVKNLSSGSPDAFKEWSDFRDEYRRSENPRLRKRFESLRGETIAMPGMLPQMRKLMEQQQMPFDALLRNEMTKTADKARIRVWLERFQEALPAWFNEAVLGE